MNTTLTLAQSQPITMPTFNTSAIDTVLAKYRKNIQEAIAKQLQLCKYELTAIYASATRREPMTGLLNHAAFDEDVASIDTKQDIGIAFIDINGLKYANDKHGHAAGDKLIFDTARILSEMLHMCSIYRTGGDEFVAVAKTDLQVFHDNVCLIWRCLWGEYGELFPYPTMAIGGALGKSKDIKTLLKRAEQSMYLDKAEFYKAYPEYDLRNEAKKLINEVNKQ